MKTNSIAPDYKGFRFPPEVISHAVWLYFRFSLSFRDVEELLAQRGIVVSYETVRECVFARLDRPTPMNDAVAVLVVATNGTWMRVYREHQWENALPVASGRSGWQRAGYAGRRTDATKRQPNDFSANCA